MGMAKKYLCIGLSLITAAAVLTSGCSGKKEQETEAQTEPQTFMQTEPPTEKQTEPPTEAVTEKPLSLKEVQVKVIKGQREGSLYYEIADSSGTNSGNMTFQADTAAFMAEGGGKAVYTGRRMNAFNDGSSWKEVDGEFSDLWSEIYSGESTLAGRTEIDGRQCYHIQTESDEVSGYFTIVCAVNGYSDVMLGEVSIDYYVDPETFEIIRTSVKSEFQGDYGDSSRYGQISMVFGSRNAGSVSITEPVITPETEPETETGYEKGNILSGNNAYQNHLFDIQVVGGDLFTFDKDRTESLAGDYASAGSAYTEEAYAEGVGGILNIVSIKAGNKTKDEVLNKYMTDSAAASIQAAGIKEAGSMSYVCSTATINGTSTKTYCNKVDDRALLLTIYFSDDSTPGKFEVNIYGFDENPFWSEETWTLGGKIDVKTPAGYTIIKGESSDLYVCLRTNEEDINVFAISGRSVDTEAEKEIQSSADTTRELLTDEWLTADDNTEIRYISVHNTDASYDYYTYIGITQMDGTVVKYYVVSTSPEMDYREKFKELVLNTTIAGQTDTQDSSEAGTENTEQTW